MEKPHRQGRVYGKGGEAMEWLQGIVAIIVALVTIARFFLEGMIAIGRSSVDPLSWAEIKSHR
ncbi:hypothetical protein SAMN06264849_104267 [Melghirimyces algeriensis]|uniref:Uncharacterized protein n=1 Tax=Melghirimyces algeriensis TaxID=910412 RepID=A0A521CWM8_9BACL|nr:hypothetical protein SAMN06264849_104267 [Melghirimyces algeriensis]